MRNPKLSGNGPAGRAPAPPELLGRLSDVARCARLLHDARVKGESAYVVRHLLHRTNGAISLALHALDELSDDALAAVDLGLAEPLASLPTPAAGE